MKRLLFLGLTLLLYSCFKGQEVVPEEKVKGLFPDIKKFSWTSSGNFIIAESNCLTLVPDVNPNQNGFIRIEFIKVDSTLKWHSTYKHFAEIKDIENNVQPDILNMIKLKLTQLGEKTILNVGMIEHSDIYKVPPIGHKYAVFGMNYKTGEMNRYYFTASGEFIDWRKTK